ncbi:MAG: fibronectin type III domain-containing protein, partial [Bryobacteraceae bacterium]|nr:fibronectin type III domain-containing protein [Bryobacteraceae bacterium]
LVSKLPVHTSNEIGFFVLVRTSGAAQRLILGLHVPPPAPRGAIINWRTSEPATCFVAYGNGEPGWRTRPATRIKHSEALTQLQPGTQYSFRVECRAGEATFPTVTGTFRTAPP